MFSITPTIVVQFVEHAYPFTATFIATSCGVVTIMIPLSNCLCNVRGLPILGSGLLSNNRGPQLTCENLTIPDTIGPYRFQLVEIAHRRIPLNNFDLQKL